MSKSRQIPILLISLFLGIKAWSQPLPDSIRKKIDSLYSSWDHPGTPGCTVGIIRNDQLIFAKGYGMANLEYAIPNTPEILFHMASVSKQFTAWSILLLARQGKLSLDDDIHKYLKGLTGIRQKITIRNLLNHTSGIRDQWQLLAIAGTRLDDVITQDHILKILSQQHALNFPPGEKYSYSNSGFTLLAEIVKAVSGQTLRQFTDSAVFKPLGMTRTHFHDNYTEIEKNRSYSYESLDSGHYANAILSYSNAGATSLFTNINDMSKWVMNFYLHRTGDQALVDTLTHPGKLNNGKILDYACGIMVNKFRGWKQYSHGGADAGYRTYISVFPDLKLGFIVFSNLGDFNPGGKVEEMASLLVKDSTMHAIPTQHALPDSTLAILKDSARIHKYMGDYIGVDGLPFRFEVVHGKMVYHIREESNVLIESIKDSFYIEVAPEIKFAFAIKGKDTTLDLITPSENYHLKKYRKDSLTEHQLLAYTGTYYCPELDCRYGIEMKDHHLTLTNAKYNDAILTLVNKDHLINDNWWMNHIMITRDAKNNITGFEVNDGRIMHLQFYKTIPNLGPR